MPKRTQNRGKSTDGDYFNSWDPNKGIVLYSNGKQCLTVECSEFKLWSEYSKLQSGIGKNLNTIPKMPQKSRIQMILYWRCLIFNPHLLYILTSVRVLCTPNAGWNMLFNIFRTKRLKKEEKQENWWKFFQK